MPYLHEPQGFTSVKCITGYHAHIYFETEAEEQKAALIRDWISTHFTSVRIGRWHHKPVGPHPLPMYQLAFSADQMPEIVSWLMLNRLGLVVLLHPETGNDYADHANNAAWLGKSLSLRLEAFL